MKTLFRIPAQLLILLYRWCISPFLPVACRFHPTCSHYAKDALEQHGLLRGLWLAALRLARCNPWGTSGFDPVPPALHFSTFHSKNERS